MSCYLNNLGIVNALGGDKLSVMNNLFSGSQENIRQCDWVLGQTTYTASVPSALASIESEFSEYYSRNNHLALHAIEQLSSDIEQVKARFGTHRVAVVIGTSTSGIAQAEKAVAANFKGQPVPRGFCYQQIEMGSVAEFVAQYLGLSGPAYTISTACSSSGHALNSAMHLLNNNIVDAVIAGGVDSLCHLTVNGFSSLESVSDTITNPFSLNRKGITIGEGAALFLITREPGEYGIELMAVGASSDAYHISAPEPDGVGAERAIRHALDLAQLNSSDITYVNLHGTGTKLNDLMESKVTSRIFGEQLPCSSSKGLIGHTLGAAAANEAGLCWLSLLPENKNNFLPPHLWDGQPDPDLLPLNLVECGRSYPRSTREVYLSSSFAFGGNNTAVILGQSGL